MSTTSCDWILELLEIRAWFYLRLWSPAPEKGVRDPVVLKDGPWGCKVFPVGSPTECGGQHQLARDTWHQLASAGINWHRLTPADGSFP